MTQLFSHEGSYQLLVCDFLMIYLFFFLKRHCSSIIYVKLCTECTTLSHFYWYIQQISVRGLNAI